jgi:raffinose/stachyose/melibiose transport system permease protein
MGDMRNFFKHGRTISLTPNYLILTLLVIVAVGPVIVLAFNSLKGSADIGRNPLGLPPLDRIQWHNYPEAWVVGNFSTTTVNSLILVVATLMGVLILGGLAAYSLARLEIPGGNYVTLYLLVGISLPLQLFLVPLFYLWHRLGLINSLFGLVIIYIATMSPFSIFLLRSYMVQLPRDFEDAARIDGCNELQVFTRIVVPLSWPAFLTVGLVVSLNVWNEFLLATVFLTDQRLHTVVTSYYNFTSRFSRDWGLTSAAGMMMIIPILIIFLSLQRRFIAGLTQGGVKG